MIRFGFHCWPRAGSLRLSADAADWATVKGQVVFPADKAIPEARCRSMSPRTRSTAFKDGDILDETVLVNPKNRGIKNVVVWLRPGRQGAKARSSRRNRFTPTTRSASPPNIVIDQPCCMFVDRVTLARVGDTLVVKNSAPVPHNFFWTASNNGELQHQPSPKMDKYKLPNALVAESPPIQYKCTIHGWMTGYVRIFDHPYFAITDDGREVRDQERPGREVPHRVLARERRSAAGRTGRFGEEIEIKGPTDGTEADRVRVTPKKN